MGSPWGSQYQLQKSHARTNCSTALVKPMIHNGEHAPKSDRTFHVFAAETSYCNQVAHISGIFICIYSIRQLRLQLLNNCATKK